MSNEYTTLGQLITLQRGYDLTESERRPGYIPVVGSAGVHGYHDTAKSTGPGVTLGRSGASFGKVTFVAGDYWPHNTTIFVKDFKGNDARFIRYLLESLDFSALNSGSAQPSLNRNYVYPVRVKGWDLATQRRIAGILSAYDELIENSQRRIKILDEVARAMYREWFVQFRFPSHKSVSIVRSRIGEIPDNWDIRSIKHIAKVTYGFPFQSKRFNSEGNGLPIIRIRDIPDGLSETFTDESVDAKYHVRNGHILVGMDGDFHMCVWAAGHAVQNQRVARFESKGEIATLHLFFALEKPIREFNKSIVGTTVPSLPRLSETVMME